MRNMKRIPAALLTLLLALSLVPGLAFAAGTEAKVGTAEELVAAISNPEVSKITVTADITLTQKLSINRNLIIDGAGHTITGQANDKTVYLEVTDGKLELSRLTFQNFGSNQTGENGDAVIKVPDSASSGTMVTATNVHVKNFSRSAYDLRAGSFRITGGVILCTNDLPEGSNTKLTKGILAGLGSSSVTGTIQNVAISGAGSNYTDWNSSAIEIYNHADVSIDGCRISDVKNGIHVDNYYGSASQDVAVSVSNTTVEATKDALKLYSTYSGHGGVANASLTVSGGSYSGNVRIVGKTEKDTLTISGGTYTVDPTEYLDGGYSVYSGGGKFVVYQPVDAAEPVAPDMDGGSAVVTEEDMNNAISSALAGDQPQVTIEVPADENAQSVSVTIPSGNLDVLAQEQDAALTITSGMGTVVTFGQEALQSIAQQAGGAAVTLEVAYDGSLSAAQQAVVGDNVAVDLALLCGGTAIGQFGGSVEVSLPFALAEDKDASDVTVYYVAQDGAYTACETQYADGVVTFTTDHFSTYMVGYASEMVEVPGTDNGSNPDNPGSPATGDSSPLLLWTILLVLAAAGIVAVPVKKKH